MTGFEKEVVAVVSVIGVVFFGVKALKKIFPGLNKGNEELGVGGIPPAPPEDEQPKAT